MHTFIKKIEKNTKLYKTTDIFHVQKIYKFESFTSPAELQVHFFEEDVSWMKFMEVLENEAPWAGKVLLRNENRFRMNMTFIKLILFVKHTAV